MKNRISPTTIVGYPPIASGEPILCNDGYWHVKWTYQDGTAHTTGFGWKNRKYAELLVAIAGFDPSDIQKGDS